MKNVIIEARENANLHIAHLEPICSFIEEIDAGFTKSITFEGAYSTILAYNRALAQPLTLSMFVPCDSEGNPMNMPEYYERWNGEEVSGEFTNDYIQSLYDYQTAEKAVLFEGWKWIEKESDGEYVRFLRSKSFIIDQVTWSSSTGWSMKNKLRLFDIDRYGDLCNERWVTGLRDLALFTKDNPLKLRQ